MKVEERKARDYFFNEEFKYWDYDGRGGEEGTECFMEHGKFN